MKKNTPHMNSSLLVGLLGIFITCSSAKALMIDFNDYTPGDLAGQPASGTEWSGGGSDFLITAGGGVESSNAVITQSKTTGITHSLFSPSDTDVPGFNGATSILEVSFTFLLLSTPDANTNTVAAIQFGYDGADANVAARFWLTSNGNLNFNRSNNTASVALGNPMAWNTITAILNYSTQTYSFSINGIPYVRGINETDFQFRGPTDGLGIRLANQGSANWKQVAFDNITVNVIPEPSSVFLALIGTVLSFFLKKRRSFVCS